VTVQIQNPGKSGLNAEFDFSAFSVSGSMAVGFGSDDWKVGLGMLPTTGFFGCGSHGGGQSATAGLFCRRIRVTW
jgi:hypothetical protein